MLRYECKHKIDSFLQYLAFSSNLTLVVLRAIEIANGVDEVRICNYSAAVYYIIYIYNNIYLYL